MARTIFRKTDDIPVRPATGRKTTLANEIAKEFKNNLYFRWDIIEDKKKLILP